MDSILQRNGKTKTIAIFGNSLDYSLSPGIQNKLIFEHGLNAVYIALEFKNPEAFLHALGGLTLSPSFIGANFTNPFKSLVTKMESFKSDERARTIGAANTLYRQRGEWFLTNTDVDGIQKTLEISSFFNKDEPIETIIIGAGGAAASAVFAIRDNYPNAMIRVFCRDQKRAHSYVIEKSDTVENITDHIAKIGGEYIKSLIVNTTPLGQNGEDNPFAKQAINRFASTSPKHTYYFDMTYSENPALRLARDLGLSSSDGKIMLTSQAQKSFQYWKAFLEAS